MPPRGAKPVECTGVVPEVLLEFSVCSHNFGVAPGDSCKFGRQASDDLVVALDDVARTSGVVVACCPLVLREKGPHEGGIQGPFAFGARVEAFWDPQPEPGLHVGASDFGPAPVLPLEDGEVTVVEGLERVPFRLQCRDVFAHDNIVRPTSVSLDGPEVLGDPETCLR